MRIFLKVSAANPKELADSAEDGMGEITAVFAMVRKSGLPVDGCRLPNAFSATVIVHSAWFFMR